MDGSTEQPCRRQFDLRAAAKRAGARLLLLAGVLVFLSLVLEVGTRLLTDTAPPLKESDPVVGHRYVRSYDAMVFNPEVGHKVHLRFNSVGFRGPDRPQQKPSGVRRIAVLGDSMVAALEMEEPDTMAGQLERLLNEPRSDVRWEVLNFGLSGASPADQLVLYRRVVASYQPDVVLGSYFCGNDLTDSTPRLSNNPRFYFDLDASGRLHQLPASAAREGLSRWLNHYSRFYVWQKDAIRAVRGRFHRESDTCPIGDWAPFFAGDDADLAHAWQVGAAVIRQFADEVERDGSRFVLLSIPSAKQIYQDHFLEIVRRSGRPVEQFDRQLPDRRLADLCREAGITCVSLTDALRAAAPSGSVEVQEEWLFNSGRFHWNQRGNRLAAETVFRHLADQSGTGSLFGPSRVASAHVLTAEKRACPLGPIAGKSLSGEKHRQ